MRDYFFEFHPIVTFFYFASILCFSMIFMHPICLILSLIGGISYSLCWNKKKVLRRYLIMLMMVPCIAAVMNMAFNHEGMTILCYLPSGNPVTLEAIIYGYFAGMMLVVIWIWFESVNHNLTSDKLIYLFGKVLPTLGLMLSMILRFVPYFKTQLTKIKEAQMALGRQEKKKLLEKIKQGLHMFSILVTWALENAIDTADSMKSRGYGLKGRTSFSLFKIETRDRVVLILIGILTLFMMVNTVQGNYSFQFYPYISFNKANNILGYVVYAMLCIMPYGINRWEEYKWRSLEQSS